MRKCKWNVFVDGKLFGVVMAHYSSDAIREAIRLWGERKYAVAVKW